MKPRIISPCTAEHYTKDPDARIAEFSVNGAGGLFSITDSVAKSYSTTPPGTKAVVELYRLDDTIAVRVDPDRLDLGEADRAKLLARYAPPVAGMLEALKAALPELESELEQRQQSGNAENWESLAGTVTAVQAAIAGAPAAAPSYMLAALRNLLAEVQMSEAGLAATSPLAREHAEKALAGAPPSPPPPPVLAALKALRMVAVHTDEFGTTEEQFDAILAQADAAINEAEGR